MATVNSTQMKIKAVGDVITSDANEAIALIRVIDTKHDFPDYFFNYLLKHYLGQNVDGKTVIEKDCNDVGTSNIVLSKTLKSGADVLHKIIDYKHLVRSGKGWIIRFGNHIYNVGETTILEPRRLSSFVGPNNMAFQSFYEALPPERDVIIYITGKKDEFKDEKPDMGVDVLRKIMGVSKDSPTYVSKDAFGGVPTETVKKLFNMDQNADITCYTSNIMDPATEKKVLLSNPSGKVIKYKFVFCYIDGDPIYIHITKLDLNLLNLQFSKGANTEKSGIFEMTNRVSTPTITDASIQICKHQGKKLAELGALIKKKLGSLKNGDYKSVTKTSEEMQSKYFLPILQLIQSLYPGRTLNVEHKGIITMASKTVGDQTYIFDAIAYEHHNPLGLNNIHGTFVASLDTFLNDCAKHTKSVNSIQATRFGKSVLGPSDYELCIYLKPLNPKKAQEMQEMQDDLIKTIIIKIQTVVLALQEKIYTEGITFEGLRNGYIEQKYELVPIVQDSIQSINVVTTNTSERQSRSVNNKYNISINGSKSKEVTPSEIENYVFTCTYNLQGIIRQIQYLNRTHDEYEEFLKEIKKETLEAPEDMTLKKANGLLNTANTYLEKHNEANEQLKITTKSIREKTFHKDNALLDGTNPDPESIQGSLNKGAMDINRSLPKTERILLTDRFDRSAPERSKDKFIGDLDAYEKAATYGVTKDAAINVMDTVESDNTTGEIESGNNTGENGPIQTVNESTSTKDGSKNTTGESGIMSTGGGVNPSIVLRSKTTDDLKERYVGMRPVNIKEFEKKIKKIAPLPELKSYLRDQKSKKLQKSTNLQKLKDLIVTALTVNVYTDEKKRCEDILQILDAYHYNTYMKEDDEGDLINTDIDNNYYDDIGEVFLNMYQTDLSTQMPTIQQTTLMYIKQEIFELFYKENDKENVAANSGYKENSNHQLMPDNNKSKRPLSLDNIRDVQRRLIYGGKRTRKNRCNKKRNTKSRKGNAGKKTYKRRQCKKNKTRRKRSS